jgi:hypothetical protein
MPECCHRTLAASSRLCEGVRTAIDDEEDEELYG